MLLSALDACLRGEAEGGSPVLLNWAIDSVRKGARVSVTGVYRLLSAVKFGDAMSKGPHPAHESVSCQPWPRWFSHIQNGYLKPNDLVRHRIPLEHIAGPWVLTGIAAYRMTRRRVPSRR